MYDLDGFNGYLLVDPLMPPYIFSIEDMDRDLMDGLLNRYKVFRWLELEEVELDRLAVISLDRDGVSILIGYESLKTKLRGGLLRKIVKNSLLKGEPISSHKIKNVVFKLVSLSDPLEVLNTSFRPIILRVSDLSSFIDKLGDKGYRFWLDGRCGEALTKYKYLVNRYGFEPSLYIKFLDGCRIKIYGDKRYGLTIGFDGAEGIYIVPNNLDIGSRSYIELDVEGKFLKLYIYR